jgi:hypothetical protein
LFASLRHRYAVSTYIPFSKTPCTTNPNAKTKTARAACENFLNSFGFSLKMCGGGMKSKLPTTRLSILLT